MSGLAAFVAAGSCIRDHVLEEQQQEIFVLRRRLREVEDARRAVSITGKGGFPVYSRGRLPVCGVGHSLNGGAKAPGPPSADDHDWFPLANPKGSTSSSSADAGSGAGPLYSSTLAPEHCENGEFASARGASNGRLSPSGVHRDEPASPAGRQRASEHMDVHLQVISSCPAKDWSLTEVHVGGVFLGTLGSAERSSEIKGDRKIQFDFELNHFNTHRRRSTGFGYREGQRIAVCLRAWFDIRDGAQAGQFDPDAGLVDPADPADHVHGDGFGGFERGTEAESMSWGAPLRFACLMFNRSKRCREGLRMQLNRQLALAGDLEPEATGSEPGDETVTTGAVTTGGGGLGSNGRNPNDGGACSGCCDQEDWDGGLRQLKEELASAQAELSSTKAKLAETERSRTLLESEVGHLKGKVQHGRDAVLSIVKAFSDEKLGGDVGGSSGASSGLGAGVVGA